MNKSQLHSFFGKLSLSSIIIAGFLSITIVYQIHRLSGGFLLTSRFLSSALFLLFWGFFLLNFWPWNKLDIISYNKKWIYISVLMLILASIIWSGNTIMHSRGDYLVHKEFTLQLLNGETQGHLFYKDAPGYYPFLSHASLAVFSNLIGLPMHYNYLLVCFAILLLIPAFSYELARTLNFSPNLSLFFAGLISLYGGFFVTIRRMFHLYLPALQLMIPSISRSFGFLLFLIFLILCFKIYQSAKTSYDYSITLGVLIGLMGVNHPQSFFLSLLFIPLIYILRFKTNFFTKNIILNFLIIVFISIAIASLYYVPAFIEIAQYGGLTPDDIPDRETFPNILLLYGPLLLLGSGIFWGKRNMKNWMLPYFLLIA
ncbi:MAG: hypothetical protein PHW62_02665, partial [Candidatus Ratteibacteria bacterium]|nr:hypothetical protein [Candidatus Ratteibacteria bacterium]